MNTLRVLLAAPLSQSRPESWALYDEVGRCTARGRDVSDVWPRSDRREAVIAAPLVRIVALKLPPMPATRVADAATFALENQLASAGDLPVIAVSPQRSDGTVLACIGSPEAIASAVAWDPPFTRVIAEPALAPIHDGWTWYASGARGGFVRRSDGSAFAVDAAPSASQLQAELASALKQAAHASARPRSVGVAHACDDATLAQWTRECGIPFTRVSPWRWDAATPEAFAAAPDMRAAEFASTTAAQPARLARLFRPALALTAFALALHISATIAQWAWLKFDVWRTARSIASLAHDAGLSETDSPDAAARAIAKWDANLRHRAGQAAAADAVPLLARAAHALSSLPPAALKSATYADGAWTIELGGVDAATLTAVDHALTGAGVTALQAKTAGGYRMRIAATL